MRGEGRKEEEAGLHVRLRQSETGKWANENAALHCVVWWCGSGPAKLMIFRGILGFVPFNGRVGLYLELDSTYQKRGVMFLESTQFSQ